MNKIYQLAIAGAILQSMMAGSLSLAHADGTATPTHAAELKEKFDAASASISTADLLGDYLGRCFASNTDEPKGMVLTTIQKQIGADEGPLFPATGAYKMSTIAATDEDGKPLAYTVNDQETPATVNAFWEKPIMSLMVGETAYSFAISFADLVVNSSTAVSTNTGTFTYSEKQIKVTSTTTVKKGSDGFFYVNQAIAIDDVTDNKLNIVNDNSEYCYFYQKL